ncbi:hypothetical protein LTSEURB_4287 [Salmonella enterica subsp. enterica serovar Urbana str. R8-2977]|uniref:Uncharacterized protein n=1 Tax=Salmonella enterica subsp. enterica serovar Urbana str. R8-2977 TaxID=913084 RepID=G5RZM8_SALET|nr:hypothetical protein LTSEURB_4287 [Salmonella enterica subsp. enterica serovar Urbana str. R8-2977]
MIIYKNYYSKNLFYLFYNKSSTTKIFFIIKAQHMVINDKK